MFDLPGISDHFVTTCEITKIKSKSVICRNFKAFYDDTFYNDLNTVNWDHIFSLQDVNRQVNDFNLLGLFNVHAPLRRVMVTEPHSPWLNEPLKDMFKFKNNVYKKFKLMTGTITRKSVVTSQLLL